jgi:surfeit locus 1 family protein
VSEAPRQPPAAGQKTARSRGRRIGWFLFALAAFVGFIALGNWQVRRLHWKLGLIHDVATRVHAPPVAAPGPDQWPHIAAGHGQFLHVRLRGHFLPGKQTLVRGTSKLGYGYWVMAPLRTDRGFVVLVNRGYVPSTLPGTPGFGAARAPTGEVTLTGLLRYSEPGGGFLRSNRPDKGQWYSRDVAAIAKARGLPATQVAPYYVDAQPAADAPRWPAAGLTVIHFPNHHLGYAITWYLLALGSALGMGIAVRDGWRRRSPAERKR